MNSQSRSLPARSISAAHPKRNPRPVKVDDRSASNSRRRPEPIANPAALLGAILALGVIRLIERQDQLDNSALKSVSRPVSTRQEIPND